MAENSKIEWTRHTWNPWIGCTEVSPACDHCYARVMMDERYHRVEWGAGMDRIRTSEANRLLPYRWNKAAAAAGERHTVFCLSLGDIWDNEVDPFWRDQALTTMWETPNLIYLLLSKRIGNAVKMAGGPMQGTVALPPNAALGSTMVNQPEWDRDSHKLAEAGQRLGALFTFASVERLCRVIAWFKVNMDRGGSKSLSGAVGGSRLRYERRCLAQSIFLPILMSNRGDYRK